MKGLGLDSLKEIRNGDRQSTKRKDPFKVMYKQLVDGVMVEREFDVVAVQEERKKGNKRRFVAG